VGLAVVDTNNIAVVLLSWPLSSIKTVPPGVQIVEVDFTDAAADAAVLKEHTVVVLHAQYVDIYRAGIFASPWINLECGK
jgi:hypothetical protein